MDSFWQAALAHNWEQPAVEHEYRLYYQDDGTPLYYSMEDLPGNYIVIDKETYHQSRYDVVVRDNKIVKITWSASWKLVPCTDPSFFACNPQDITLIDEHHACPTYWKVKTTHEAS